MESGKSKRAFEEIALSVIGIQLSQQRFAKSRQDDDLTENWPPIAPWRCNVVSKPAEIDDEQTPTIQRQPCLVFTISTLWHTARRYTFISLNFLRKRWPRRVQHSSSTLNHRVLAYQAISTAGGLIQLTTLLCNYLAVMKLWP